jgi:hypothetical protein
LRNGDAAALGAEAADLILAGEEIRRLQRL